MGDENDRVSAQIRKYLEEDSDPDSENSGSEQEDVLETDDVESTDADDTDADETYQPPVRDRKRVYVSESSNSDIEVQSVTSKKRRRPKSLPLRQSSANGQVPKTNSLGLPNTNSPATAGTSASPDVPPNDDSLSPITNTHNQNSETLPSPERPTIDQSMHNQPTPNQPMPDQPTPDQPMPDQSTPDPHLFIPNARRIRAKNGHVWNTQAQPNNTRTPMRNLVFSRREVVGNARNSILPLSCFMEIFDEHMFNTVVIYTNEEIERVRNNYNDPTINTIQPTNLDEMKAFVGLLVNSAWSKDNHLAAREMFDSEWSGSRYKCVMTCDRFQFLVLCLRFDDKATRNERKRTDPFAPIRDVWEAFILNCRTKYKPGSYVTIDEQLLAFRGKCPFRMYIPNKPAKYGVKLVCCCDNTTNYMIDSEPYLGKKTPTGGQPAADYFVKKLTTSIQGSNRSVTTDNWFTNIKLAEDLLQEPFKLTTVGTIRLNRKGVPSELGNKKEKPVQSSMFLFDREKTLVSYKPKHNKVVVLLSTMHRGPALHSDTKKPEIIHTYNSTKGAVDTLDKMCGDMSCSRKTRRWPLCIFYGILNIAFVNSYVIYCMNNLRLGNKPLQRKAYMKQLCKELTEPHMRSRLEIPQLRRNTRTEICELLGIPVAPQAPKAQGARKTCFYCPAALRRMTTTYCVHCGHPICGQHRAVCCLDCDK